MLVSHRKQFIFTKTVKTAGTSVESYFEPYCVPEGTWTESHARDEQVSDAGIVGYRGSNPAGATWVNHMPAERIRELLGEPTWNRYFKFTIIRNPFDKMVSGFFRYEHQLQHRHGAGTGAASGDTGDAAALVARFRAWLASAGPIVDRNKYVIDGEECVDDYIRFESLHEGIARVCARLAIAFEPARIPEFKKGIRHHAVPVRDYYDAATERIVRDAYEWELRRFGYDMPEG